ncbi:MAG: YgaP family membrane protein [Gemmatimonadales bacterium]
MVRNLSTIERLVRLIVGAVILGLFGAFASPWRYLTLVGLLPLGTALTGHCPIYRALGRRSAAS